MTLRLHARGGCVHERERAHERDGQRAGHRDSQRWSTPENLLCKRHTRGSGCQRGGGRAGRTTTRIGRNSWRLSLSITVLYCTALNPGAEVLEVPRAWRARMCDPPLSDPRAASGLPGAHVNGQVERLFLYDEGMVRTLWRWQTSALARMPLLPITTGRQVRGAGELRCADARWVPAGPRPLWRAGHLAALGTMSCWDRCPGWPPGWTVPCRGCRGACHVRTAGADLWAMSIVELWSQNRSYCN